MEKATNQIADCHQIGIRSPCCHESSALLYRPPCSRPMYHLLQPVSLPRRPPAAGQKDDLTYKFVSRDGHLHEGPCADLQSICLASMSISFCQLCRHQTDNFVVDDGMQAGGLGPSTDRRRSPPVGRSRSSSPAIGVTSVVRYASRSVQPSVESVA